MNNTKWENFDEKIFFHFLLIQKGYFGVNLPLVSRKNFKFASRKTGKLANLPWFDGQIVNLRKLTNTESGSIMKNVPGFPRE